MSVELPTVEYFRGDQAALAFRIRTAAGAVVDITGRTYRMGIGRVRHPQTSQSAAFVVSVVGTIIDGPAGRVAFQPTSTDFDGLALTDFNGGRAELWYDIEETSSTDVYTYGTGQFIVLQDLSK